MKENCLVIKSSADYGCPYKRFLCIDTDNWQEIWPYLERNEKKFRQIQQRILTQPNIYYDHYGKEGNDNSSKNVTAIKFTDYENTRIYCQELKTTEGIFFIICSEIFSKKSQKNNKTNKPLIEKVSKYEYNIQFPDK